jgi:hypothetical protein
VTRNQSVSSILPCGELRTLFDAIEKLATKVPSGVKRVSGARPKLPKIDTLDVPTNFFRKSSSLKI